MNIQEFHINFDESCFADLRKRIAAIRWPEGASFNGWQHGTPNKLISGRNKRVISL